jgi:hypothetical protein
MSQNISDLPANSAPFNFTGYTAKAFDNRYEGVRGTYTFFEDFRPGMVELKRGKFTDVLINYDAYTDNLLAKNDKMKDTVQLRKDMVIRFAMKGASGEEALFVKKNLNGTPTFLYELVLDSISVYCKVSKTIKKADFGGAYNTSETRYDEFVTVNTYYVVKEDGKLQEIQNNKKGILKAFPEFEGQLSAYLKKNKIDFNDYGQVKLIVQYINELKK